MNVEPADFDTALESLIDTGLRYWSSKLTVAVARISHPPAGDKYAARGKGPHTPSHFGQFDERTQSRGFDRPARAPDLRN